MPIFTYQGKDRMGRAVNGQMEADSIRTAAAKLREENLYITSLNPGKALISAKTVKAGTTSSNRPKALFGSGVKLKDLLVFTRQFSVMISAGVNLVNCLNLLAGQCENKFFAPVIQDIRRDVESGSPLHVALGKFPKVFPTLYIHMVEAGEASGQLETVLKRVGDFLEGDFELRKKVSGAMVYPMVIVTVAIAVVMILMTVVVPQFLEMFNGTGVDLPVPTKILIAVSWFMQNFWYVIVLGIVGLVIGLTYFRKTPQGHYMTDLWLYRMKVIGPVIQKVVSARFSRTLSTLLESGVMITNSLELVEKAVGNMVVARAVNQALQNITKGSGLAKPLEATGVFPGMVTQMVAVGEETGELSTMLDQVASFYEKEAGYAIEAMTSLIEPAIIVVLGGVVAIIVSAIMLPMFEISTGATMGK